MRRTIPIIAVLILAGAGHPLRAADEVQMKDGAVRKGRVVGADETTVRIALPGPRPGQPGGTASIPRETVDKILFAPDPALEAIKANPGPGSVSAARVRWQALRPMLAIAESRGAEAGNIYAECLRLSGDRVRRDEALGIYAEIEQGAWNPADRETARRGRLRTMIDLGRSQEVAAEIEELASSTQDPELLLDSKLLVADARLAALRQLLADNPRWDEDPPVRAERLRLLHETADNALHPFLFHGTARAQAAKGLAIALDLYRLTGNQEEARKIATDLEEIYPDSPEAAKAAEFLPKTKTES